MTTDITTDERPSRRVAFAEFVAFGDTRKIRNDGDDSLVVTLDSLHELHEWAAHFLPSAPVRVCRPDESDTTHLAYATGPWKGWTLHLNAIWPVEDLLGALGDDTWEWPESGAIVDANLRNAGSAGLEPLVETVTA